MSRRHLVVSTIGAEVLIEPSQVILHVMHPTARLAIASDVVLLRWVDDQASHTAEALEGVFDLEQGDFVTDWPMFETELPKPRRSNGTKTS